MTRHERLEHFKASCEPRKNEPAWVWDDDIVPPYTALEAAGYLVSSTHGESFKAFAIIHGLPIFLGAWPGRAAACRAIVDAHHGGET
jgi:hypothetical protein